MSRLRVPVPGNLKLFVSCYIGELYIPPRYILFSEWKVFLSCTTIAVSTPMLLIKCRNLTSFT